MDYDEEYFKAYAEAIARCRWFLIITTLLSSLILFHIYLEQWSFQTSQYRQVLVNRAIHHTEDRLGQMKTNLIAAAQKNDVEAMKTNSYGKLQLTFQKTSQTLSNLEMTQRKLPLLELDVPGNDYTPILAFLTFIFSAGVWLNVRATRAPLELLDLREDKMRNLARIHRIFTGVHSRATTFSKCVRLAAFFFPVFAVFAAGFIDIRSVCLPTPDPGVAVGTFTDKAIRVTIWTISLLGILLCTIRAAYHANKIDGIIDSPFEFGNHASVPSLALTNPALRPADQEK